MKRLWRKVIVGSFAMVGIICLFLNGIMEGQYGAINPSKPQPEFGRIHPINVHGAVVYLNKSENFRLEMLFWAGISLIFIAVVTSIILWPFNDND